MISDFSPIPEKGVKYISPHGDIYTVTDTLFNLGAIPDTVVYVSDDDPSLEFQDYADDWNSKEFKLYIPDDDVQIDHQNSTDVDNTGVDVNVDTTDHNNPSTDSTGTSKKEKDDEGSSSSIPHSSQIPSGFYSSDPKINELAGLLESGPSHFNQNFFPTDKDLSDNNMVEKDVEDAFQKTLDEITKLREEGKTKRVGFLNEFLWTCGGLDKELLRMCPVDWAKKTGMGGTILGTAILASFSGGYAAFTVFDSLIAAIFSGIIWGLVIFNLDRYLVNSMFSDGKASISWPELRSGLPRILIAFFIGIVIATPIELKIFEGKINAYIDKENRQYVIDSNTQDLSDFNAEATRLKGDYDNASNDLKILRKCIVAEEQGLLYDRSNGEILKDKNNNPLKNPRGAGNGKEYQSLKDAEQPLKKRVDSLKSLYDNHMKGRGNLAASSKSDSENRLKKQLGLSKKLEVLSKITDEDNSLLWTRVFISLFFIILEVLPVFSKMMQQDGKYDKLVDLESDTMDKLTRIKEFNNINVLRSGHLSIYRAQILGHSIIDEENEGNNAFFKQDRKKQNKDETDADNQDIYRKARSEVKKYIMTRIEGVFNISPNSQNSHTNNKGTVSKPIDNPAKPQDVSDEAEII